MLSSSGILLFNNHQPNKRCRQSICQ